MEIHLNLELFRAFGGSGRPLEILASEEGIPQLIVYLQSLSNHQHL